MEELTFTIDKQGNVVVDAQNFHGKACKKVLEDLLQNSGIEGDTKWKVKPEFYEAVRDTQKNKAW